MYLLVRQRSMDEKTRSENCCYELSSIQAAVKYPISSIAVSKTMVGRVMTLLCTYFEELSTISRLRSIPRKTTNEKAHSENCPLYRRPLSSCKCKKIRSPLCLWHTLVQRLVHFNIHPARETRILLVPICARSLEVWHAKVREAERFEDVLSRVVLGEGLFDRQTAVLHLH